jgi:carbon-monoxide dehydrogenase medium subunit
MIATTQIRSRGTFGGSLSHADPSAELVAVSVILDGRFHVRSQAGDRWVPADEFFVGICTTQMAPVELLTEVAVPPLQPRSGWAMMEIARLPHDVALVGVAAVVNLDENRRCQGARIGMLSVGDGPVEAHQAAAALIGQAPTPKRCGLQPDRRYGRYRPRQRYSRLGRLSPAPG